jgi:predicted nuclease of predicted toxin-antitoxin system
MSLKLYMDHHVPRAITIGLRMRNVDVLTAFEDGAAQIPDPDLLDRATSLGRILFTQDSDLLAEANVRQQAGISFSGIVYAHQQNVSIGQCVQDLEVIATVGEEWDLVDRVIFLPL